MESHKSQPSELQILSYFIIFIMGALWGLLMWHGILSDVENAARQNKPLTINNHEYIVSAVVSPTPIIWPPKKYLEITP